MLPKIFDGVLWKSVKVNNENVASNFFENRNREVIETVVKNEIVESDDEETFVLCDPKCVKVEIEDSTNIYDSIDQDDEALKIKKGYVKMERYVFLE